MLLAELATLFRRMRVKALLAVLAAIPAALAVAVYFSGGPSTGRGPTFLDQVSHNGMFAALAGLTVAIPFFLPLVVAVVSGDAIAGEANLGTLRYLLTRPSGRTRLLATKAATVAARQNMATVAALVASSRVRPDGRVSRYRNVPRLASPAMASPDTTATTRGRKKGMATVSPASAANMPLCETWSRKVGPRPADGPPER